MIRDVVSAQHRAPDIENRSDDPMRDEPGLTGTHRSVLAQRQHAEILPSWSSPRDNALSAISR